jgi:hypothetical protein
MFFGGFLRRSNYDRKKRYICLAIGWNVWGFHELGLFWQVPQSNYNRKKRYSCLAIGCNVWGVGSMSRIVLVGSLLCFLAGSLIKLQITTKKKRYSCLAIGWNVYYVLLTYYTLVDRLSAMTPRGIYPGRKILASTWGLLVPSARRGLRKDTMVDGWRPRRCRPSYSSILYTICNIRDILFLLCLYLKRGNKLNIGIVWFEGKAPSRTSKTCLTMVEPFAGPSSMAMGNQPMPSRYPLHGRLSEGGVLGFC